MVVLAVTWMAKVGHEAEVAALFEKLTEQSRKEPGCAMYQVHRHKTEPRRFFIYEQYKDDAALEAHRTAPHFLQFARKDLPKVADRVEGHLFEPLVSRVGQRPAQLSGLPAAYCAPKTRASGATSPAPSYCGFFSSADLACDSCSVRL